MPLMTPWHVVGYAALTACALAVLGVIGASPGVTVPVLGIHISPFSLGSGAGGLGGLFGGSANQSAPA